MRHIVWSCPTSTKEHVLSKKGECVLKQLNRCKEMGLELEKQEWYAPVKTSHESVESTTHNWQKEI